MRWRILHFLRSKSLSDRQEEMIQALFKNRGLISRKQQQLFLDPPNPYQFTYKDVGISPFQIKKAVSRIRQAIKSQEKIIVYGDYDTDGVCATAIVWETLNRLGVKVMPFIPKREEGYGLKVDRIDQLAKEGIKLIVTVDQGIVHTKQIAHAKKLGIEVIITDHHQPGEKKPAATAIIHSTLLAGTGVAWFLAQELAKHFKGKARFKQKEELVSKTGLGLAAIGTITDMVSLVDANRSIVKFGLEILKKTKRPGLRALFDFSGINQEIGPYEVGFIIGPRLNAAGRMEDPMDSLRLLCTRDENRAISLAQKIDTHNRQRQKLMEQTIHHARNLWLKQDGKNPLIFVYHQSYEYGVTGLVAGHLKDEFYRPAVVLAPRKDHWVASARSIDEFSIVGAIRQLADIIEDHGGHHLAAGFSIKPEKLEEAKTRLIESAKKTIGKKELTPTLAVDCEINLIDINMDLFKKISQFAPFGIGNHQPVFVSRGVQIIEARTVGKEGRHLSLKFQVPDSKLQIKGIGFNMGDWLNKLAKDKTVAIAYCLILNEWNGNQELQLKLKDIKRND